MNHSSDLMRDRSSRLFTFLSQLAQLRLKSKRTLDTDKDEQVFWFADLPKHSSCECIAWDQGDQAEDKDIWLKITKPSFPNPPTPPTIVQPWIKAEELSNATLDQPALLREIADIAPTNGHSLSLKLQLIDQPDVLDAYSLYLEDKWRPWSLLNQENSKVQQLYNKLFGIFQK